MTTKHRCRKCGAPPVINMPQHRLALCAEHFPQWIVEQTERFIRKYHMFTHEDRLLAAVSGGKDSLSLWDILWQLGYTVDGLYISLGIDDGTGYSAESQAKADQFAAQRNLKLIVVDVPALYGESIPQMTQRSQRSKGKPCSVCGLVKRRIMDQIARDNGYDVLVTGHNLDDEAATLLANTLIWDADRILRQQPVLEAHHPALRRKAKPLFRFYEREMAAYALLRKIDYIYDECPYAEGTRSIFFKQLLNRLETVQPGAKLKFYLSFLQARESGLFNITAEGITDENMSIGAGGKPLYTCPSCGQPTIVPGLCAFCRLVG
ncbi:MAG: adenine nucleotide alpha hydrolase family protein [Anaerolineales bacterium]|nr:adenine nucleotide alpha hydrolase family protein [Anaerolineales bacterium]